MKTRIAFFAMLIALVGFGLFFLVKNRNQPEPGPPFALPAFDLEREGGVVFTFSVPSPERRSGGSTAFKKRQTEGVVQRRLEAQGIRRANLRWLPVEEAPVHLEIAVPPQTTNIIHALKESLRLSNPLQFHGVDVNNDEWVGTILGEKTPDGYKVAKRQLPSDAGYYSFLIEWEEQDWRANPDAAKRLGVDLSSSKNLLASLQSQTFQRARAEEVAAFMRGSKSDLMLQREVHQDTGEVLYTPVFVEVMSRMDGKHIRHAKVKKKDGSPEVVLTFHKAGRKEFAEVTHDFSLRGSSHLGIVDPWTGHPIGRRLAIVLEGKLITAPTIHEPMLKGVAPITGSFTPEEAEQLAADLNTAADVYPLELRSVDELPATGR